MLAGFVIRGFTGFGSVVFILPLLALWLPVKAAVPLLAVLGVANGAWLGVRCWGRVDRRELSRLLLGALPGMGLGMLLFQLASAVALRQGLGGVLVVLGIWMGWLARPEGAPCPASLGVGVGVSAGFLGALFGVSGPMTVAYLARRGVESAVLRATVLLFILAIDAVRAVGYAAAGSVDGPVWLAGLGLLPASAAGAWLGERLQLGVPEATFRRILGGVLIATGALFLGGAGR